MSRFAFVVVSCALLTGCANHAQHSIALYEHGDYAAAAQAADSGLAAHPDEGALWGMRVRSAIALGDADAADKAYAGYAAHRSDLDGQLLHDLTTATLAQALASPSAKLKLAAIAAVEEIEIQDLADKVAERMGDDDDRVAAAAAVAILRGGYAQAPQVAGDSLRSPEAEARLIAVNGIGKKIGKLAAADITKAADDRDPRVRRAAVYRLGQMKDADSVALFAQRMKDEDAGVRAAAARAMARVGLGDLGAFGKAAAADADLGVRLAGIDLLVAAHADAELAALAHDADPMVAAEAAIAVHAPELARAAVAQAIASPSWTVRAGAANLLSRAFGKPEAIAAAKTLAGDKELSVRLAAARALVHAGDPADATPIFVVGMAEHPEPEQAAADLAALGDARGTTRLAELVRDQKRSADQRASAAAAHVTARRVTPGLVAALADPNAVVRVAAAAAIGALAKHD